MSRRWNGLWRGPSAPFACAGWFVLVTSSHELRILNSRFRGEDKTTDVLSFPPIFGLVADFAGDVAISAEIAGQNARCLGHSVADEIKILVLHGVLHLAGYDHERDGGAMARKEMLLRRKLGLPLGLIERGEDRLVEGEKALTAKCGKTVRKTRRRATANAAGGGARSTRRRPRRSR